MGIACCKEEEIDFSAEGKLSLKPTGKSTVTKVVLIMFNIVVLVELNHFLLLRSVGKGAFGKVSHVLNQICIEEIISRRLIKDRV